MIYSSKYVFVKTKSSWFIGSFQDFLSFSSDGTTIAGTKERDDDYFIEELQEVQFWETATGAATSSFKSSLFVVFSPTDPDIAALVRPGSIHMLKRDSFKGKTWGGQHRLDGTLISGGVCTFNSSGKTIVVSNGKTLFEYNPTTWSNTTDATSFVNRMTCVVSCPIKPSCFIVGDDQGELEVVSGNLYTGTRQGFRSHGRLTPVDRVGVSACAWSQDGKWIATGNNDGDIFLWNAGYPINFSFAMQLPRKISMTVTSLVFVPDSTALIIISGGHLSVWDIENAEYVANSGLPDEATNVALDGPRNRLAVVVDEKITIYELKLAEEMCQMDGKSSIPSELAEFDITNEVVKFDSDPLVGLYFDIYRGAWKFETPRIFQHVVAIKALRPRSDNAHEQQEFEDRLLKFLARWAELTHDNLVPLLGVSTAFGKFPAVITSSWMTNGLLSEYIKADEKYDKMKLVTGVARGVAYLHSENIVHSDIRGSSFLVDDFGQARLADPGLLCVLTGTNDLSKEELQGTMSVPYRWMAPELLLGIVKFKLNPSAKATFATDVYSVTMTSLEIFTASDPFTGRYDSDTSVVRAVLVENKRPDRPEDVDDKLWSLWGEGWNQNAALRPDMEKYVERLTQLV